MTRDWKTLSLYPQKAFIGEKYLLLYFNITIIKIYKVNIC